MCKLNITEIDIIPILPKDGLVAFASAVINNQIYIGSIAIHTSPNSALGYRLVYPIKILPNGKTINCVRPINKETGELIQKLIIEKFQFIIDNVIRKEERNAKLQSRIS